MATLGDMYILQVLFLSNKENSAPKFEEHLLFLAGYLHLTPPGLQTHASFFDPWNTSRYSGYYENLIVIRVAVIFLWGEET
jgi:hypothetical protein